MLRDNGSLSSIKLIKLARPALLWASERDLDSPYPPHHQPAEPLTEVHGRIGAPIELLELAS